MLNTRQQMALEMYMDWYRHPEKRKRPWFEISGPAGSGKTFLVRQIMNELGITDQHIAYMAYVGKATLALRLAGVPARTIHSSIYDLVTMYKKNEDGTYVLNNSGQRVKIQTFRKKPALDPDWKQLVVDEAGMVGNTIGLDLLSYNIPALMLGDLKQLPPVMSKRMFLEAPDIELNEIMRQEKDSPIIYLSQLATHGICIPYGVYGHDECRVIRKDAMTDEDLEKADIVICGTNYTRDSLNRYIRKNIYHIEEDYIVPGDKLICRQNKWNMALDEDVTMVNGLIGYVKNVYRETRTPNTMMEIDFRPEFYEQDYFNRVPIDHNYPLLSYDRRTSRNIKFNGSKVAMEFGYAITCHLAQGSQYDDVLVYVENARDSLYFRQWLYTAITRAKKRLTLVI